MKPPKRIRLGLPQKPHGRKPRIRLFSFQREWLEAREAEYIETAILAHRAKVADLESRPATTLLEMIERKLDVAMANIGFNLNLSIFSNVDLAGMPLNPGDGTGEG